MSERATRDSIIEVADRLFYEGGYEHTSFADIARAVRISRGNFYYHFKTKDQILEAVIDLRIDRTRQMLERWEEGQGPEGRIRSFIDILIVNQEKIMLHGCPVGTLCSELAKLDHVAAADARKLFELFRSWLIRQFTLLGRQADADALAMHLLMRLQGIATLASAYRDEAFVRREVQQAHDWLAAQRHGAATADASKVTNPGPG